MSGPPQPSNKAVDSIAQPNQGVEGVYERTKRVVDRIIEGVEDETVAIQSASLFADSLADFPLVTPHSFNADTGEELKPNEIIMDHLTRTRDGCADFDGWLFLAENSLAARQAGMLITTWVSELQKRADQKGIRMEELDDDDLKRVYSSRRKTAIARNAGEQIASGQPLTEDQIEWAKRVNEVAFPNYIQALRLREYVDSHLFF